MVTNVLINKGIIGIMALFVMFGLNSLLFNSKHGVIDAKIYRYENNKFYGDLIVDGKKLDLVVRVNVNGSSEKTYNENKFYNEQKDYTEQKEHNINNNTNNNQIIDKKEEIINRNDKNNNENINKKEDISKKEEKLNENIKITDDYTPGSIDILIENGKVKINRDMGSKEMSDIDKEICKEIVKGTMDHVKTLSNPERKRFTDILKGFLNHLNKPKESKIKWFNKK